MRYFWYLWILTGLMWMFNPELRDLGWTMSCLGWCLNDVFS